MAHSFMKILEVMKRLAQDSPEARELVRRFDKRAVIMFSNGANFDGDFRPYFPRKCRAKNPVLVVLLEEKADPPNKEALVWRGLALHGRKRELMPMLVFDTAESHEEWFALKAIYEYGAAEILEIKRELEQAPELTGCAYPQMPAIGAALSINRLTARHISLVGELIDRRTEGFIVRRVHALSRLHPGFVNDDLVRERVFVDLRQHLQETRPNPLSSEEEAVRRELVEVAAVGIMMRERSSELLES